MKPEETTFLNDISLTDKEKEKHFDTLSNWMKVHAVISGLKNNQASLTKLKKLLLVEMTTRKRATMVERLKARFNSMRTGLEESEILKVLKVDSIRH